MGIKSGFNKFLRDTCLEIFEEIHISQFSFKKVAIDISLYMHKFKAVCGDNWLTAFINLISCLRRNEIHCVFIFDGKAPPEKKLERAKRRNDREKMEKQVYLLEEAFEEFRKNGIVTQCLHELYNKGKNFPKRLLQKTQKTEKIDMIWIENKIQQKRNQLYQVSSKDFEEAKELFDILQVPYYTAPWEAEKMCSKLCFDGKVDAVLSEDTDVMAYKAPIFLSKIDTSRDTCISINYNKLLESLGLNEHQFLDLCIMCGTDYNSNIPRVGSKTSYKHILNHGNIDNIGENTNLDITILKHNRVRELFTKFEDYDINYIPYCGKPNFEELKKFILDKKVYVNIEKLKKDFIHNLVVFEGSEDESEGNISEEDENYFEIVDSE